MSREYTNTQLERMVLGKVETPNTVFYEQSQMDPDLSKAAGKRTYKTFLMVKYTQPGVTDWAPVRAQKKDIADHPEEYQLFLDTRADVGSPSIEIIPGITPDEQQELIDYGILTITKLCDAHTVPPHLLHVQASARRISRILQQEQHANEQVVQEDSNEESQEVLTSDRRIDTVDVGRCGVPGGLESKVRTTAEGLREGGRLNRGQGHDRIQAEDGGTGREGNQENHQKVNGWDSPNWSISF